MTVSFMVFAQKHYFEFIYTNYPESLFLFFLLVCSKKVRESSGSVHNLNALDVRSFSGRG